MPSVKNLKIDLQNGTTNNYYASWEFDNTTTTTTSTIKAGDLVSIKAGATYYNGVDVPDWVNNQKWYVSQVSGTRAVLGKNQNGTNNIESPIHTKYLSGGTTTSTTTVSNLDHYTVKWYYATGDGIWFEGETTDVTTKYDLYSPPSNATKIKVSVKPVSKKYKVKSGKTEVEKSYWTGTWSSVSYLISNSPPEKASTPSVKIEKYTLTATVTIGNDEADARIDKIQFQVYNGTTKVNTGTATVLTQQAVYSCGVTTGGKYRVRCRNINMVGNTAVYGEWSDYSNEESTIPAAVTDVKCSADSETSVKITWKASSAATSYKVEYTTDQKYFDTTSGIGSTTVESTTAYITGLESGEKWYFRVCATNDAGDSGWSNIVSTNIGTKPEPPTTWSLTTTVIVGNEATLYWTHNSEDGSKMTEAQIEITVNNIKNTITVPGTVDEDEEEPIYSYVIGTGSYLEGGKILWRVRTKGIINTYSDWSTQRTIDLYARPTLRLTVSTNEDEVLSALPLNITAVAGPSKQTPISYHVSIAATESYESVNNFGSPVMINKGTELYSKVFNTSDDEFSLSISAGDILIDNGQTYDLSVVVAMDSGLTGEAKMQFSVSWDDQIYSPNASIAIDHDTLTAYITPYCRDDKDELYDNVVLSVYRREFNGRFTELATGLANTGVDTITDPHPSLDLARYRIVAQNVTTSGVSYEDLPGEPVEEPSIVIQWDETWVDFDYTEEAAPEVPPWTGSLVRLPYNVDITENYNNDSSLVKYIGREHPVSYYGTQRGESASWATVIDKKDKELIFALRRLASYQGDVYVREPSGTGYWAKITVNFPIKHNNLTVPVTFEVTRVEGGI